MHRRRFFGLLMAAPAALLAVPASAAAMDLTKMQAVAAAVTNAGYSADLVHQADGSWRVRAISGAIDIPVAAVQSLAAAQGVSAFASTIEFV
jgi:hypothetical protein